MIQSPENEYSKKVRVADEADREFVAIRDELGLGWFAYLAGDDPRLPRLREAYARYQNATNALRSTEEVAIDPIQHLLRECRSSRAAVFCLRHAPAADWQRIVDGLWLEMGAIALAHDLSTPRRPNVSDGPTTLDAINDVISWCKGIPPVVPTLFTIEDFCSLSANRVAAKTVANWLSERRRQGKWIPRQLVKSRGRKPALYNYSDLLRLAMEQNPALESTLPISGAAADQLRQKVHAGTQNP